MEKFCLPIDVFTDSRFEWMDGKVRWLIRARKAKEWRAEKRKRERDSREQIIDTISSRYRRRCPHSHRAVRG